MQEPRKEMVEMKGVEEGRMKNKIKKYTIVVCFHGSHKYTNGSNGTLWVSSFCVLLAAEMRSN